VEYYYKSTEKEKENDINTNSISSSHSETKINQVFNTESKSIPFRGQNSRITELFLENNINEETNVFPFIGKSNSTLFEEIQRNIINLKNLGKEDEIFSDQEEEYNHYNKNDKNENEKFSSFSQSQFSTSSQSFPYPEFSNSQISTLPNSFESTVSNLSTGNLQSSTLNLVNNISSSYNEINSQSKKSFSSYTSFKSKFAFDSGTDKVNLNSHLTTELEKILDYHTNENNIFESLAYRKAIAQLKNAKEKIISCEQLKKYKNLGKSIGIKVREFLLTGKITKGEYVSNDERNQTLKFLTTIWGVGKSLANKLYSRGIKNIDDLRKNQKLLNQNQIIGLKYYEDLQVRIPRKEIDDIFLIIKEELFKILPEENIMVELCGSYRRGKETCGDIDVIISRKDNGMIDGILQGLVNSLMKRKLITDILVMSHEKSEKSNDKNNIGEETHNKVKFNSNLSNKYQFMGICRYLNNPHRRIDIKIYKKENFAFALLYFTGSAYFNRSMRLFARQLGYSLSDLGLTDLKEGRCIHIQKEEDIFRFLGVDYKLPSQRDI
jgi:DNA polymerase/3'-5' exonuclease PolX